MKSGAHFIGQCTDYLENTLNIKDLKSVKWMNKKAQPKQAYCPTTLEHIANIVTHGIWILPSIYAMTSLLKRSQDSAQLISSLVYGGTLIFLFCVSTSFHCVFFCDEHNVLKNILHRCDRAMIYIFIAASYFPWLTIEQIPHEGWASMMRWFIWVMAFLGVAYQQVFHERYKRLEIVFYLIMGIFPVLPIISEHHFTGMKELLLGGVLYVSGVFFFKCDGVIPCAHAIWHLFVASAAYAHYYAIVTYLYPLINAGPEAGVQTFAKGQITEF